MSANRAEKSGDRIAAVVAPLRRLAGAWLSRGRSLVLWSFLDQAIISGFGFATGIAAGRLVGIAEFGKFAIAMIFVTLASNIHAVIFATPMMTLAGHRERSRAYFGVVIVAGSVGAVVLGVIASTLFAVYYGLRGEPASPGVTTAIGVLVAVQGIQLIIRRVLFARRKGRLAVAFDLGRYALFVVFVGGALLTEGSTIDTAFVLWALASSGFLAACLSLATTGFLAVRTRPRLLRAAAEQHWHIARWFVAVTFVGFAQDQSLFLLAGPVLGDAAIGGMRAAQYLFGPIMVLTSAMENVLPVRVAEAWSAGGVVGLKNFLVRFAVPFGAANAALILLAVLPGAFWLAFLFGRAYVGYVPVLEILGLAAAFTVVRDYLVQYFRATRRTNMIFYSFVAGFAVAVALIYPLVAWFGVVGLAIDAAISQFASMATMAIAVVYQYRRRHRLVEAGRVIAA